MKMKKLNILTILMLFIAANVAHASFNGTFNGFQIVKIFSNGEEVTTSTPAILVDGTTMVPIRVLEQFGFVVEWDSDTYSVEITPPEPKIIEVPVPVETPTETEQIDQPAEEEAKTPATQTSVKKQTSDEPSVRSINEPETTETETNEPQEKVQTEEPTTKEPEEEPDNTAVCKRIRDKYAGKIAMLSYEGLTQGQMEYKKMQLEHQRDQELDDAGC